MAKNYRTEKDMLIFDFGQSVRSIRLTMKMKQKEFAKLCHMHSNTISNIENGVHSISMENADKIFLGLGLMSATNILNHRILERFAELPGKEGTTIGEKLYMLAEKNNKTQEETASSLNLSRQGYLNMKKVTANFKLSTLNDLFPKYGLRPASEILSEILSEHLDTKEKKSK